MGRRGGAEEEAGEGQATVISLPGLQSKAVIKEGKWFKVPDLAMRVPGRVFKRSHRSAAALAVGLQKPPGKERRRASTARSAHTEPAHGLLSLAPSSPLCGARSARLPGGTFLPPRQRRRGAGQKHQGKQKAMPRSHSCIIKMFLAFEKA